jgi:hypothetical protein
MATSRTSRFRDIKTVWFQKPYRGQNSSKEPK